MATLNSKLTPVTGPTPNENIEIGAITSSQGKISEIVVSNTTAETDITYQIFVNHNSTPYPITPVTRLLDGEAHTIPMSTFISSSDKVEINIPSGKTVDTVVSVIEL